MPSNLRALRLELTWKTANSVSEDMEAQSKENGLRSYSSLGPGQILAVQCHNLAYTYLFEDPFVYPSISFQGST